MPTDKETGKKNPSRTPKGTPPEPTRRSKSPTWVGKVVKAKDEQIAAQGEMINAIKDLADDKVTFMVEQLAAASLEREKRSEALYELSEARASDMQKSSENKDITIKRLWIANVIQVLIIAALAGVTVSGNIPGVGDIGLDKENSENSD